MKKARKPVSLFLSFVMMLSLCSTSALARDPAEEEQPSASEIVQEQTESADEPGAAPEEAQTVTDPDAEAPAKEAPEPDAEGSADSELTPDEEETADPGDSDAAESGEEEPEKTDETENEEEAEEPEISLLAADDEDAPTTYEVTVVYFDENNDRITPSSGETVELSTGSVEEALKDSGLETRTQGSATYQVDWVYNSSNLKVKNVTYVKDSNGDWQLSYSLEDQAIAGQSQTDDLEIWYTYDAGTLPVSYSPSQAAANGSLNYVDGDPSVMAGETLTFSASVERGYSYTLSVTAGSSTLDIASTTAASETESGETVYTTEGEFTVDIPAGITEEIAVTAAYTHVDTITFSPEAFRNDEHFGLIDNNGEKHLNDVSRQYSDDGVTFTFEFDSENYVLESLEINHISCSVPYTSSSIPFETTIVRDKSGDSGKDCIATITASQSGARNSYTLTVKQCRENITVTAATFRYKEDPVVVPIAPSEGIVFKNESLARNGSAITSGLNEGISLESGNTERIRFDYGMENGYKNIFLQFYTAGNDGRWIHTFQVYLEQEVTADKPYEIIHTVGQTRNVLATVSTYEGTDKDYQYQIDVDLDRYGHTGVYFEQVAVSCELEQYNVRYNVNGGTGTITDDMPYDITNPYANVTSEEPKAPEDKVFYGWATEDPTGKELSELTVLFGGETMDLLDEPYWDLMDRENPTQNYDGSLTLYAVYLDELPAGTPGTAVVNTYLQDMTGAYKVVADGGQDVAITAGQSLTVYDSYINDNPNVDYEYYTYNAEVSNPYLATTKGSGDEIRLYYDLNFTGSVSQEDWSYGDDPTDPSAVLTVTDSSGTTVNSEDNKQVGADCQKETAYYAVNGDGSQEDKLDSVPTDVGSYMVEVTWACDYTALDENGAQKTGTMTIATATAVFSVTKRPVTLTAGSSEKDFDGTALTDNSCTVTGNSLAGGDGIASVTCDGSQTAVGSSDNHIESVQITNAAGDDVTESYEITKEPGTLTVNPGTTRFTVTIVWEDNSNQDGIRPQTVNVQLQADGTDEGDPVPMSETGDTWTNTWKKLTKASGDHYISYTIADISPIEGYTTSYEASGDGVTITNTHTPETIDVSGKKIWDDDDNNDGCRPDEITIVLESNKKDIAQKTVTAEDEWSWVFTDLPKYEAGHEIVYTVYESDLLNHYKIKYDADKRNVTNIHDPETISLTVSKAWEDAYDQDGLRPDSVTVQLYKDGEPVTGQTLVLSDANGWRDEFTDLDRYEDEGKTVEYTVEEVDVPDGYTASYTGSMPKYTVTNTHTPEMTDMTGTIVWDDAEDQDGVRPDSVTVTLYADGTKCGSTSVSADDDGNWTFSFPDMPVNKDGKKIVYTVVEDEDDVDGYQIQVAGDAENGFTVTNTHTPETTSISGTKTWDDADDQDGIRPNEITLYVLADGSQALDQNGTAITTTVTADENWTWSVSDLPKYRDHGKTISYTVLEDDVTGYKSQVTGNAENGFVVTNSHTPAQTTVSVSKAWEDADDQDGLRPDYVTVSLLVDGADSGKKVTLEETNNWSDTFTDLDVCHDQGQTYTYSVEEADVPDGYEAAVTGDVASGFTVTNTHIPETIDISGSKIWDDDDNNDGYRPDSIQVHLKADGTEADSATVSSADDWSYSFTDLPKYKAGKEIVYTVTEDAVDHYAVSYDQDSHTITNRHTLDRTSLTVTKIWDDAQDQDGLRPNRVVVRLLADGQDTGMKLTLNADNKWTGVFANLDIYQDEGERIQYTVDELEEPDGYEVSVTGDAASGYTITNTHTPETVQIDVDKIWDDAQDQDGKRPASITVNLLADGTKADSARLSADRYGSWGWNFTDLPKYRDEGTEIVYTITEDPIPDYNEPDITGDVENGFEIYNTHIPETIDITGRKTWDDDDNNDGDRPESITIRVKADGSPALDENGNEITATVTEGEDWSWDFNNLPKYDAGKEISYTITEDAVAHYATGYEDSYSVVNVHTPDQTSLTVTVAWDDSKNQDGLRPASVTLKLLADGEDTGRTVVLSASNSWTAVFTGLDMEKDGSEVTYTVEEAAVPDGYTVTITGDSTIGYTVTDTHTPETIEISGGKTWDDDDNNDGDRPDSITIRLLADNQESQSLTVTAADNWSWNFTDLPKYEDGGIEIAYTVTEDTVPQYATTYSDYNVRNTHTPDQTSVTVTKVWDDKNDQDGIRPASVTVKLLADGQDTDETLVLSASSNWKGSFTGLDMYEDQGEEIKYTVEEKDVPAGYESGISGDAATGYTITNTHTPETITISGSKNWNDDNNNDGDRPDAITIRLKADGVDTDDIRVTAADDWSWNFTDLPKYKAGKEISYTVTEDAIDHYSTIYRSACEEIVNVHTPDMTSLTVSVAWYDEHNQDGIRPDSLTLKLLADGEDTGRTLVLSASDNWRGTFNGLDIFEDQGNRIQYTVEVVDEFDGYESDVTGDAATGYTITFTHVPVTIDISGSKTWLDDDNNDGDRPDAITIRLLADGKEVDHRVVTEEDGWTWTFTGYDQYRDGGVEVVYTITEDAVDNYATNVHGYDVTNIHTPEMTSVTVTKVWDDLDDQDGIRPDNVTVKLLADGEDTGKTALLGEQNHWMFIFTGLDQYQDDGSRVVYTVEEAVVPEGYTREISGNATEGYIITNSHETEIVTGPGPATGNPETGNPTTGNPETGNPTGTKTGDVNNLALWIVLLMAAGGLAAAARRIRRNRTR